MAGQPGFFDAEDRLRWLSASGDPLERLRAVVDFEAFRAELEAALPRADRSRGGRPPWDAVLMFRVLVLQALYTLSDDQTEYQLRDRLSFMRFVGLALQDAVPDAKTIWLYREQLTRAGALAALFARFDAMLAERGFLAMGGQIVDATIVEARRPRLTKEEKATLRGGDTPEGWSKARTRQIDRDGRWTLKRGRKAKPPDGAPRQATEIAVPMFGYKNHLGVDRTHGFIRRFVVTDAAQHDSAQLGAVLDPANTGSGVWADTAYRSKANLELLDRAWPAAGVPTRQAAWAADARPYRPRQCDQGPRAQPGRACLRCREARHAPRHPVHRLGARHGADHAGQPSLQHTPPGLDRGARRARLTSSGSQQADIPCRSTSRRRESGRSARPSILNRPQQTPVTRLFEVSARRAGPKPAGG